MTTYVYAKSRIPIHLLLMVSNVESEEDKAERFRRRRELDRLRRQRETDEERDARFVHNVAGVCKCL